MSSDSHITEDSTKDTSELTIDQRSQPTFVSDPVQPPPRPGGSLDVRDEVSTTFKFSVPKPKSSPSPSNTSSYPNNRFKPSKLMGSRFQVSEPRAFFPISAKVTGGKVPVDTTGVGIQRSTIHSAQVDGVGRWSPSQDINTFAKSRRQRLFLQQPVGSPSELKTPGERRSSSHPLEGNQDLTKAVNELKRMMGPEAESSSSDQMSSPLNQPSQNSKASAARHPNTRASDGSPLDKASPGVITQAGDPVWEDTEGYANDRVLDPPVSRHTALSGEVDRGGHFPTVPIQLDSALESQRPALPLSRSGSLPTKETHRHHSLHEDDLSRFLPKQPQARFKHDQVRDDDYGRGDDDNYQGHRSDQPPRPIKKRSRAQETGDREESDQRVIPEQHPSELVSSIVKIQKELRDKSALLDKQQREIEHLKQGIDAKDKKMLLVRAYVKDIKSKSDHNEKITQSLQDEVNRRQQDLKTEQSELWDKFISLKNQSQVCKDDTIGLLGSDASWVSQHRVAIEQAQEKLETITENQRQVITLLKDELREATGQLAEKTCRISDLEALDERRLLEVNQKNERIQTLETTREEMKKEITQTNKDLGQVEVLNNQLGSVRKSLEEAQRCLELKEIDIQLLQTKLTEFTTPEDFAILKDELSLTQTYLQDKDAALVTLSAEISNLKEKEAIYQSSLNTAISEKEEALSRVEGAGLQHQALRCQLTDLQAQLVSGIALRTAQQVSYDEAKEMSEKNNQELRLKVNQAEELISSLQHQMDTIKNDQHAARSRLEVEHREAIQSVRAEHESLRSQKRTLEETLHKQTEDAFKQIESMSSQILSLNESNKSELAEERIQLLETQMLAKDKELKDMSAQLNSTRGCLDELNESVSTNQQLQTTAEADVKSLKEQITGLRKSKAMLSSEIDEVKDKNSSLQQRLGESEQKRKSLPDRLKARGALGVERLDAEETKLVQVITRVTEGTTEKRIVDLENSVKRSENHAKDLEKRRMELEIELKDLKFQNRSLLATKPRSLVDPIVFQQMSSNNGSSSDSWEGTSLEVDVLVKSHQDESTEHHILTEAYSKADGRAIQPICQMLPPPAPNFKRLSDLENDVEDDQDGIQTHHAHLFPASAGKSLDLFTATDTSPLDRTAVGTADNMLTSAGLQSGKRAELETNRTLESRPKRAKTTGQPGPATSTDTSATSTVKGRTNYSRRRAR
ncbi:Extracellular matrix glycoprotein Laminin subunits alpha and gamma [Phaffia rhodozyma]|uniref:Extracellular matrix glycoprotein Laminin subunits alpha and gamma n=1 Tax=Phaffia rhodozyma TaxID=264483 RepID=A0A0F7SM41_PHARH|nr:Extracellular matrix glycoprotein Laminin subunits alpha and gamma [Phaffia rhodozyma]